MNSNCGVLYMRICRQFRHDKIDKNGVTFISPNNNNNNDKIFKFVTLITTKSAEYIDMTKRKSKHFFSISAIFMLFDFEKKLLFDGLIISVQI